MTLRVGLDCDGVLYDFVGAVRAGMGLPDRWQPERWDLELDPMLAGRKVELRALLESDEFALSIEPYDGARGQVERLADAGVEFCFVTAPLKSSPTWCYRRARALYLDFPRAPVVFTAAKHLVKVDFLVDDSPTHVQAAGDRGLQIARPWNNNEGTDLETAVSYLINESNRRREI